MKNIKELRGELSSIFTQVKSKKLDLPRAKALVGTANSILKSVKIELDHNKFVGNKKPIDFM